MQIELTHEIARRLEDYAALSGKSVQQTAEKVLGSYLNHVDELGRDVREAEAEADRDGWLTNEQAFAKLRFPFKKTA